MYNFPSLLTDNIWLVGNYYFNLYLVKGEKKSALIEAGVSGMIDDAINQLKSLDIAPSYLVVTHPHPDHLTGLEALRGSFPKAEIIAGEEVKKYTSHPKFLQLIEYEDNFTSMMLSKKGLPPKRPSLKNFEFPDDYIKVGDKYKIDLGGITLKLIKVKGHAMGNIIAHVEEKKTLIVSDSLGFHYPKRGFFPLFLTSLSDHIATIDYLKSLKPEILCLAHQCPLIGEDAEKAFIESKKAAIDVSSEIVKEKDKSDKIEDELFKRFYKDELTLYSENNIRNCCNLLIKRSLSLVS